MWNGWQNGWIFRRRRFPFTEKTGGRGARYSRKSQYYTMYALAASRWKSASGYFAGNFL